MEVGLNCGGKAVPNKSDGNFPLQQIMVLGVILSKGLLYSEIWVFDGSLEVDYM